MLVDATAMMHGMHFGLGIASGRWLTFGFRGLVREGRYGHPHFRSYVDVCALSIGRILTLGLGLGGGLPFGYGRFVGERHNGHPQFRGCAG